MCRHRASQVHCPRTIQRILSAQRGRSKASSLGARDVITVFDFHPGDGTCLIEAHSLKGEVTKGQSAGLPPAQSNARKAVLKSIPGHPPHSSFSPSVVSRRAPPPRHSAPPPARAARPRLAAFMCLRLHSTLFPWPRLLPSDPGFGAFALPDQRASRAHVRPMRPSPYPFTRPRPTSSTSR